MLTSLEQLLAGWFCIEGMEQRMYVLSGVLSLVIAALFFLYDRLCYCKKPERKRTFSHLVLCGAGVFLAVFLVFLPIYCYAYPFGDEHPGFRVVLLTLHNTMRVFILDGEFDIVRDAVADLPERIRMWYSLYAAVLYVLAPLLTFGTILSLFQDLESKLRFRFLYRRAPIYIMSQLNEPSLVLARSILTGDRPEGGRKPVVVFADVRLKKSDELYDLYLDARELGALCLRQDITDLDLSRKKGAVRLFLIGADESENVGQAVDLIHGLEERAGTAGKKRAPEHVKVFTFAESQASLYTLESQKYPHLLEEAKAKEYAPDTFKSRRINVIRQLVWNTVPGMKLVEHSRSGVISVLLVGMGRYGMEFFKMLLWYCQIEGYHLELNVVDQDVSGGPGEAGVKERLRRACPGLMEQTTCRREGFADYDIHFYEGVDMRSDRFRQLLTDRSEKGARLRRTTHVLVTLGEDDINIETAVYLRELFERCGLENGARTGENADPDIYAVVYDEKKSGLLKGRERQSPDFLINYKETPYQINFIGSVLEQYDWGSIYNAELEAKALEHHDHWVEIKQQIAAAMRKANCSEEAIKQMEVSDQGSDKERDRELFERFEYYRESSISKELHRKMLEQSKVYQSMTCTGEEKGPMCQCEGCTRRKKAEHMRWDVYTMVNGYSRGKVRVDRAKVHDKLVDWDQLSDWDKAKNWVKEE